ncbi:Ku protein [Streptomyces europaeiscabiei]|uniref:Ku protein n=1 Tax=Streptomyces europaeiscabiei TaxID=146819 RepID=UPI0038F66924
MTGGHGWEWFGCQRQAPSDSEPTSATGSSEKVAIPVQLYAATKEHTVRLHEIHTADGSRVQHRRFCAEEGREIPFSEVGRGVALPDGRLLPLSEQLKARITTLEQQVIDLELKLQERDDDLAAARAANRELMAQLNRHAD